jgi:glycosyltransferase involved in cell wall biosynthesis
VQPATGSPHARPIRLAILDDNPFVRLPDGEVRPRAALFHRFAEAVVAAGPFEPATYLIPVADLSSGETAPPLGPVDQHRLHVAPTAPFEGIAGYLRHGPALARRNWPIVRDAVRGVDLVWIKAPASNALLALVAARRARRPFFTWVAGSARAVVAGQPRKRGERLAATSVAAAYDAITGLLTRTGPSHRLDEELFTSLVTAGEVAASRSTRSDRGSVPDAAASARPFRIVWAGRIVADKGLPDLLDAIRTLRTDGFEVTLDVVGDGPDRPALVDAARQLQVDDAIRWTGFVGNRELYLGRLRAADAFVLPSRAEGVPKVLIEAMAAGLPIVATTVGAIPRLLDSGRLGHLVPAGDPNGLAASIRRLHADPVERMRLRVAGLDFAAAHTIEAQAERLVDWLRAAFPRLAWPRRGGQPE